MSVTKLLVRNWSSKKETADICAFFIQIYKDGKTLKMNTPLGDSPKVSPSRGKNSCSTFVFPLISKSLCEFSLLPGDQGFEHNMQATIIILI